MHWIAPSEKATASASLEKRLWDAADQFRANSGLKAQEYSGPILGLIFLRFAEVRFAAQRAKLDKTGASSRRGSRVDEPAAYHADNVLYLAPEARFDFLLTLPERADVGAKVNAAMREVEKHNPQLAGVLPKTFNLFTGTTVRPCLSSSTCRSRPHEHGGPPSTGRLASRSRGSTTSGRRARSCASSVRRGGWQRANLVAACAAAPCRAVAPRLRQGRVTGLGTLRLTLAPSPSCPSKPFPQQYVAPPTVRPQV